MAVKTEMVTEGLYETLEAINEISPRISKYVIGKATARASRLLIRTMKQLAPVDTGKLRASIKQRKLRQQRPGMVSRFIGPSWPDGAAVNLLEYGTGASRDPGDPSPSGSTRKGIAPVRFVLRTFLRSGIEARDLAIEDAIKEADKTLEALGEEKIPQHLKNKAGF